MTVFIYCFDSSSDSLGLLWEANLCLLCDMEGTGPPRDTADVCVPARWRPRPRSGSPHSQPRSPLPPRAGPREHAAAVSQSRPFPDAGSGGLDLGRRLQRRDTCTCGVGKSPGCGVPRGSRAGRDGGARGLPCSPPVPAPGGGSSGCRLQARLCSLTTGFGSESKAGRLDSLSQRHACAPLGCSGRFYRPEAARGASVRRKSKSN